MSLPEADIRRAVATAALMVSVKDGEALDATRALCRILSKHGLSPAGILAQALAPKPEAVTFAYPGPRRPGSPIVNTAPRPVATLTPFQQKAWKCRAFGDLLTERELEFVLSMVDQRRPTEKQENWLNVIVSKVERLRR